MLTTSLIVCSPDFKAISNILFSLVAILSFLNLRPIFFEIYPARMSPKFPVGTEKTIFSLFSILLAE